MDSFFSLFWPHQHYIGNKQARVRENKGELGDKDNDAKKKKEETTEKIKEQLTVFNQYSTLSYSKLQGNCT